MIKFANIDEAEKIVKQLYPEAKDVRFVEHGYDNLVCLIDDKYAIKFPRYDHAYIRDKYEKLILQDLKSLKSFSIPKVIKESDNPPFLVISFVSDVTYNSEEIGHWSNKLQKKFAEKLAQFAFSMHSLLSIEKAKKDKEIVGMNYFDFYDYALSNFTFPVPEQEKIAKDYYRKWKNLEYKTPQVVIHNDLNTENLLFKNKELFGIIDFGDARIGYAEQEFRQLYRINEFVLKNAVKEYEKLANSKLNIEAIKINSIVQELAAYANKLSSNSTDYPGFLRAKKHLQKWLPKGRW